MNLQQQKEILELYTQYQATNKDTIKANLKMYMDRTGLTAIVIADQTKIPLQTIYQLRKHNNNYKPDFIAAMTLCDFLQISIMAVMEPIIDLQISEPQTKWNATAKKEFVTDYKTLEITELCKKYSIMPRTAQEYNRVFMGDLEG